MEALCSRITLFASIAVCLCLCRFPILLAFELNPDEGQFLAASHKLFYDSNFFRAVDCGTSGPLSVFPLMLPAALGFSPDYASSRVLALLFEFLTIFLLYRVITLLAADRLARITILPVAGAFAVFRHTNLVHYSSEHLPMLLIAMTLYCAVRILANPAGYRAPTVLIGLLSTASFFAKMQAVPMALTLALIALVYVHASHSEKKPWMPAAYFFAGALPLVILNAVLCIIGGAWTDFWLTYVVANRRYVETNTTFIGEVADFPGYVMKTVEVRYFLLLFLAIAAGYWFARGRSQRNWRALDPVNWFGLLAVAFTASAAFSIFQAHRPFPHYLLFLFTPVSAAIGWMLIRNNLDADRSRSLSLVAIVVALTVTYQSFVWFSQEDWAFKRVAYSIRTPAGNLIRWLTSADGQIVVWGWAVAPYLGSGRVAATRDLNMSNFFRWPSLTDYYCQRFLRDLRENPAEVIIDAIGPTSWDFSDHKNWLDRSPEINSYFKANYTHVMDRYGQRFYLRRDLPDDRREPPVRSDDKCEPEAIRCSDTPFTAPRELSPVRLPGYSLLETTFTPVPDENADTTVFSNVTSNDSYRGFQLVHTGGDRYRLGLGMGADWAWSQEQSLAPGKAARLAIELNGDYATVVVNGEFREQMLLPRPVWDSDGPISLGSSKDGQHRFKGTVQFFRVVDLEKAL